MVTLMPHGGRPQRRPAVILASGDSLGVLPTQNGTRQEEGDAASRPGWYNSVGCVLLSLDYSLRTRPMGATSQGRAISPREMPPDETLLRASTNSPTGHNQEAGLIDPKSQSGLPKDVAFADA